jgi:hypothetical protein
VSDLITLPVMFINPVFKVDGSVKLVFETRELPGSEIAILADYRQKEGWLLFSANELKEDTKIPDEKADSMTGQKTQAQRLRGVIYRLWEQNGRKGDSENYYRSIMEGLIEQLKEKLE